MALPLEQYALVGDTETAALVGADGSVDWLCLPRFDSGACFSALLGTPANGHWQIAPVGEVGQVERRYCGTSLVLETDMHTAQGSVRITDCMPPRDDHADVVRLVEGLSGRVDMHTELVIRFDYGWVVPWVRGLDDKLVAIAGPDALSFRTPIELRGENLTTVGDFTIEAGQRVPFVMSWHPSHLPDPGPLDAEKAVLDTTEWWQDWSSRIRYEGPWHEAVVRSLVTLKALTYGPTGAIVAAPTTSLPEQLGGSRNWDYRYCWLRDATFTLQALIMAGLLEEAAQWRDWLLRTAAGNPAQLQVLYGAGGERRLPELTLDWLDGYEGSRPVRIGNQAATQFQLDIYGEVIDSFYQARLAGISAADAAWELEVALADFVARHWREPDEGIWEIRGPRRQFTHSRVLAWVALDRAVKSVERFGLRGPAARWRRARDLLHAEICDRGYSDQRGSFVQAYGSEELDASLLLIPLVGFLSPDDPRVKGTMEAVRRELTDDHGFVSRYRTATGVDGLPGGENVFLACSFWLVDNLAVTGRIDEAAELFERLLGLRNDVGLLSEEYDVGNRRLVGNFPQAFSHVGLVNSAYNLAHPHHGPAKRRRTS
jgi:GH15 family glucan-1,4-alpha-glucosidase